MSPQEEARLVLYFVVVPILLVLVLGVVPLTDGYRNAGLGKPEDINLCAIEKERNPDAACSVHYSPELQRLMERYR